MKLTSRVLQIGLVLAALAIAASSQAQTLNRYWGDMQGDNSQLGTPTQYFSFGRDSVGLDVVALTAHASQITDTRWVNVKAASAAMYQPGVFVPLSGYEWNNDTFGHKPVYFLTDDQPLFRPNVVTSDTPAEYYALIATTNGLLHAAHPALSGYLTNWSYYNAPLQPNAEIVSRWGVYETSPTNGRGLREQWASGKRIGVLGSSDSHTVPGTEGGITAIMAQSLTRSSIFDALRARHTYATNGARIGLDFGIGGKILGDVDNAPVGDAQMQIHVDGTAPLSRIEIRRSNTLINTYAPPPQRVFVEVGAPLSYFKGTVEPPADWNTNTFSDAGWLAGRSGIGFGNNDDVTVVTGMVNKYFTLYTRQTFAVTDNAPQYLYLGCDYDDGFIAYVDGVQVARVNMPAGAVTSTTPAGPFRNPNMGAMAVPGALVPPFYTNNGTAAGTPMNPALDLFDLTSYAAMLTPGTHTLAIEIHNSLLSSNDLTLIPRLFEIDPSTAATVNFTDAGATGDRWYDVKVIQVDGGIAWSTPIWLNPDAPPRPVCTLTDVPADNGVALDLSWTKSVATDFDHYDIFVNDAPFTNASGMTPLNLAPITNPDSLHMRLDTFNGLPLVRGKQYSVFVGAFDSSGKMNAIFAGAGTSAAAIDNIAPNPATALAVIDTPTDDGGSLRLTWTKSLDDGAGMADVSGYEIYRKKSGTSYPSTPLSVRPAGSVEYFDNTPLDGTNYFYRIRCTDGMNVSAFLEVGPVTSVNNGGLAEPKSFTAADRPADQGGWIKLTWALIGADANITRYDIYRTTTAGVYGATSFGWVPNGTNTFNDSTTADAQDYWYVVQSDSAGVKKSTFSLEVGPVRGLDNIAPAAIAALTATNTAAGGTVALAWPGYPEAAQGDVAGYDIYQRSSSFTTLGTSVPVLTVPAGAASANITGLVNGTNYWFAVVPVDEAGNRTTTVISMSARPTDAVAPAFAGLTGITPGDGTLTLSWNAAQDNTLPISYQMYQSLTPAGFNFTTPTATISGTAPIVPMGASWHFLKGTSAPPALWKDRNFDDSGWLAGEGAFGYDTGNRYQPATVLSDMNNAYTSVYFRANFNLASIPQAIQLGVLVDDGFIAYINGVEVTRDNMNNPANFNSLAASSVNPSWNAVLDLASPTNYTPNPTLRWIDLSAFTNALYVGKNTLAVQVHNYKKSNADFLFLAQLDAANVRTTVSGLSASNTYYYVMRASDGAGNKNTNSTVMSGKPLQAPPPAQVAGFTAVKSGSSVLLRWSPCTTDSMGATFIPNHYNIYRGTTVAFVPDVVAHSNLLGTTTGQSFTDAGALNAAPNYFYRVYAVSASNRESWTGSALAMKSALSLSFASGTENAYWIAIPYLSGFVDAQSLVNDLNRGPIPGPVRRITRFNATTQLTQALNYEFGAWVGDNFPIIAGEAYAITLQTNLTQALVGAHNPALGFNFQSRGTTSNIYWLGLPYSADYTDAQALLDHLNGGAAPAKVAKIIRFDAATGAPQSYLYFANGWRGQNFGIVPGQGYGIVVNANVNGWRPRAR